MFAMPVDKDDDESLPPGAGAMIRRLLSALAVALPIVAGGYVWQHTSLLATEIGAEQARGRSLQMSAQKQAALAREAASDAARSRSARSTDNPAARDPRVTGSTATRGVTTKPTI
jgi:hypothetical protein